MIEWGISVLSHDAALAVIKDNELVLDESIMVSSHYIKQVIEELKQKKNSII